MADNEDDAQTPIQCKVVLLGESGVGKTSIIARYLTNTFSTSMNSTAGANFTTKTVYLEDSNKGSHFNVFKDSYRIYKYLSSPVTGSALTHSIKCRPSAVSIALCASSMLSVN